MIIFAVKIVGIKTKKLPVRTRTTITHYRQQLFQINHAHEVSQEVSQSSEAKRNEMK